MRSFFDTNVLVYLFDGDSPGKRDRARELLETEVKAGRALLSTQVLQEFYVTVTRKLGTPLSTEAAENVVREFAELPVAGVDRVLVLAGIRRSQTSQLSFWDALVVETALQNGATTLYTEDLHDGAKYESLVVENPFREGD